MAAKLPSDLGVVEISDSVLAKIVGVNATECFGVLGLASSDGLLDLLKKDSVDKGVRISSPEEGIIKVDVSLILKYGVSMRAVAHSVMETIRYQVERLTGLKVADINVVVRGVRV